jgi:hypothetical protein
MGKSACYVYTGMSINRLDYYINYVTPFGFTTVLENQGCSNHHSIVDIGGSHFFFNKNYGFCRFDGSTTFPADGRPVSHDIENWIRDIRSTYYGHIIGAPLTSANKIAWVVPLEGATTPNAILYYDYYENKWTRKDVSARYLAPATINENVTWTTLGNLGYTTWSDLGNLRWADLIDETPELLFSPADGKLYTNATESEDGSAWDGYRVEPVMQFGPKNSRSFIKELWFNLCETGDYSLYVYYRGGDTEGECKNAVWTAVDEVSCDSPKDAICYLNGVETANRFHQIKWGTDGADEPFVISSIEIRYTTQSRY